MAGKITANVLQLGDSVTATQNFVLQSNVDGSAKLARGNAGATTQDILTVDASGNVNAPVGIQKAGSVLQALSDFTGSNVSLAASGYQKLPGGLIIQWGVIPSTAASTSVTVTYPVAFTTAIAQVVPATSGTVATDIFKNVSATVSQATFRNTSGGTAQSGSYIAIGY